MSNYFESLINHAHKAAYNNVRIPHPSLAVGGGENLRPNLVPIVQTYAPSQPDPSVRHFLHYSQYEFIKSLPYLTEDSFPKEGKGVLR